MRKAKASIKDEPDKNVRRAKTERSEKQAAKVKATERALDRLEVADKPWRRWELQLRFGGGERAGRRHRAARGRRRAPRELHARPARSRARMG